MNAADLMRRAAALMRERADAADTDEARRPYGDRNFDPVPRDGWGTLVEEYLGGPVGAHCASWHPAVALAVADLLDKWVWMIDMDPDQRGRLGGGELEALARTYLGEVAR